MYKFSALMIFLCLTPALFAETARLHVDESVSDTENQRFSSESALESLLMVKQALDDFKQLSEDIVAKKRTPINSYANTTWEVQNIGFPNWLLGIEGTIRYQSYTIARLKYEQLLMQRDKGDISAADLQQAERELLQHKQAYETYWGKSQIVD